jgi:hypothetical protein
MLSSAGSVVCFVHALLRELEILLTFFFAYSAIKLSNLTILAGTRRHSVPRRVLHQAAR